MHTLKYLGVLASLDDCLGSLKSVSQVVFGSFQKLNCVEAGLHMARELVHLSLILLLQFVVVLLGSLEREEVGGREGGREGGKT